MVIERGFAMTTSTRTLKVFMLLILFCNNHISSDVETFVTLMKFSVYLHEVNVFSMDKYSRVELHNADFSPQIPGTD